jgi:hypothetical protein
VIRWDYFLVVITSSLVAACLLVTLFSLALRLGDPEGGRRRALSILMYVLCGLLVAAGIVLIVPALRSSVFGL